MRLEYNTAAEASDAADVVATNVEISGAQQTALAALPIFLETQFNPSNEIIPPVGDTARNIPTSGAQHTLDQDLVAGDVREVQSAPFVEV